ncbi:MAG: DNA alkylation repair protein [bacterium]
MILTASELLKELQSIADPTRASLLQWFFQTKKGQYGEGDVFLGIYVPKQRLLVSAYWQMSLSEVNRLLKSKYHEGRFTAQQILVKKYQKGDTEEKKKVYEMLIQNLESLNNWDLVDCTVPHIFGAYLFERPRTQLYKWAKSKNLWLRRISIISTMYFIRKGDYADTLKLAEVLLHDKHDLIHKAVGWTLREVGKKSFMTEKKFLDKHYKTMPRTALRYAIEKFPEVLRQNYLKGGNII